MQANGWFSVRGGAKALYEASKVRKTNLLNQVFTVSAPNQVWVSDVTSFDYKNKEYFICVILDLYARKVISHKIIFIIDYFFVCGINIINNYTI